MAGRKRKLTDKLADKILDLIADGLTIRQIFEREDINYTWTSFRKELVSNSNLMDRYQKSKELIENSEANLRKIKSYVNWKPKVSIREGIKEIIIYEKSKK